MTIAHMVAQILASEGYGPVVVVGDLIVIPWFLFSVFLSLLLLFFLFRGLRGELIRHT